MQNGSVSASSVPAAAAATARAPAVVAVKKRTTSWGGGQGSAASRSASSDSSKAPSIVWARDDEEDVANAASPLLPPPADLGEQLLPRPPPLIQPSKPPLTENFKNDDPLVDLLHEPVPVLQAVGSREEAAERGSGSDDDVDSGFNSYSRGFVTNYGDFDLKYGAFESNWKLPWGSDVPQLFQHLQQQPHEYVGSEHGVWHVDPLEDAALSKSFRAADEGQLLPFEELADAYKGDDSHGVSRESAVSPEDLPLPPPPEEERSLEPPPTRHRRSRSRQGPPPRSDGRMGQLLVDEAPASMFVAEESVPPPPHQAACSPEKGVASPRYWRPTTASGAPKVPAKARAWASMESESAAPTFAKTAAIVTEETAAEAADTRAEMTAKKTLGIDAALPADGGLSEATAVQEQLPNEEGKDEDLGDSVWRGRLRGRLPPTSWAEALLRKQDGMSPPAPRPPQPSAPPGLDASSGKEGGCGANGGGGVGGNEAHGLLARAMSAFQGDEHVGIAAGKSSFCPAVSPPPLLPKAAAFCFGVLVVSTIALLSWTAVGPIATEGAFRFPSRALRQEAILAAYFQQARFMSTSGEGALAASSSSAARRAAGGGGANATEEGDASATADDANTGPNASAPSDDANTGPNATSDASGWGSPGDANATSDDANDTSAGWGSQGDDNATSNSVGASTRGGRVWRRIELFYFAGPEASSVGIDDVASIEAELRALPGWQKLCSQVPAAALRLCDPGDSFAAVAYGTREAIGDEGAARSMGVLAEALFNGRGSSPVLPLPVMLAHLRSVAPEGLRRWLPGGHTVGDDGVPLGSLRTTFAFLLPRDIAAGSWVAFVRGEFKFWLEQVAQERESGGPLRIFCRIDGLEDRGVDRIVGFSTMVVIALGAFLAVVFVAWRPVLGLAAFCLALAAPATACAALATSGQAVDRGGGAGDGDTSPEWWCYPAAAVAAWLAVATSCTQLAIAAAQGPWQGKGSCTPASPSSSLSSSSAVWGPTQCLGRLLQGLGRCILEGVTPHLGVAVGLCVVASLVDAEASMAAEFALHAGVGELFAFLFAPVLFPVAMDLGDALTDEFRQHQKIQPGGATALPVEVLAFLAHLCDSSTDGPRQRRLRSITGRTVGALGSPLVSCLFLAATVIMIIAGLVSQVWPTMDHGMPPPLFRSGHHLRDGPAEMRRFAELPEATELQQTFPSGGRFCGVDAADTANCSWRMCETPVDWQREPGKCQCYAESTSSRAFGSSEPWAAAVRLWSDTDLPTGFVEQRFWPWVNQTAQQRLGAQEANGTAPESGPVLEMGNWETGDKVYEAGISAFLAPSTPSAGATTWEAASLRLLCFCGQSSCELGATWVQFGSLSYVEAPESGDEGAGGLAVHGFSGVATAAPLKATVAAAAASSAATVATSHIYVVWGLKRSQIYLHTDLAAAPEAPPRFRPAFKLEDPWVQRSLLAMCAGTAPDLAIVDRKCWVTHFRQWLLDSGERFPVEAHLFHTKFQRFAAQARGAEATGTEATNAYNHFWLGEDGQILGTYAVFNIAKPAPEEAAALVARWARYVEVRNRLAAKNSKHVGEAWIVSPLPADVEALSVFRGQHSVGVLVVAFLLVAGVWALVLSLSCGMAVAVVLAFFLAALYFLVIAGILSAERNVGMLEFTAFLAFVASLLSPLLRVAQQYCLALGGLPLLQALGLLDFHDESVAVASEEDTAAAAASETPAVSEQGSPTTPATAVSIFYSMEGTPPSRVLSPQQQRSWPGQKGLGVSSQDVESPAQLMSPFEGGGLSEDLAARARAVREELDQVSFAVSPRVNFIPMDLRSLSEGRSSSPKASPQRGAASATPPPTPASIATALPQWGGASGGAGARACGDGGCAGEGVCPSSSSEGALRPSSAKAERQRRITAALLRSGGALLGRTLTAGFGALVLLRSDATALGRIALGTLCGAAAALPAALGILPIFLSLGLGPSQDVGATGDRDEEPLDASRPSPRDTDVDTDFGGGARRLLETEESSKSKVHDMIIRMTNRGLRGKR